MCNIDLTGHPLARHIEVHLGFPAWTVPKEQQQQHHRHQKMTTKKCSLLLTMPCLPHDIMPIKQAIGNAIEGPGTPSSAPPPLVHRKTGEAAMTERMMVQFKDPISERMVKSAQSIWLRIGGWPQFEMGIEIEPIC